MAPFSKASEDFSAALKVSPEKAKNTLPLCTFLLSITVLELCKNI